MGRARFRLSMKEQAGKGKFFRREATVRKRYASCLSAPSGLPTCIYPCRYTAAVGCMSLPWPLTIPGTISAPIYRFDSDRRDTRDYLLVRAPADLYLLIVSQESHLVPLSFVNNASCDDWDPWPMGNGISRIFGAATIYVTLWRAETAAKLEMGPIYGRSVIAFQLGTSKNILSVRRVV